MDTVKPGRIYPDTFSKWLGSLLAWAPFNVEGACGDWGLDALQFLFYLGALAASHLNFGGGPSPAITQGSQLPRAAQTPKKMSG